MEDSYSDISNTRLKSIIKSEEPLLVDVDIKVEASREDSYRDVSNKSSKSIIKSNEPVLLDIDDIKAAKELRKQKLLAEERLREEEEKEHRKKKAMKSMSYLLQKSQSYAAFFEEKLLSVGKGKKQVSEKNRLEPTIQDVEGSSDLSKIKSQSKEVTEYSEVTQHMKYFEGGVLRDYQVEGVTWMMVLFENGLNGILADEMGLGKTVQVIALISHLYERLITGPFLIIAPLSTVTNWKAEFEKFAPQLPVLVLHGTQAERAYVINQISKMHYVENKRVSPVVVTSYNTTLNEIKGLKQLRWEYVIIDEGHRLKNHNSKLSIELRTLQTSNRLLLTGTPLQNNITELWALLNFLLPFLFKDMDTFTSLFLLEDIKNEDRLLKEEESLNVISTIHKVLAPFMLRRTKNDVLIDMVPKKEVLVYCPLSKLQKDIYSYIIEKNVVKLRGHNEDDTVTIDGDSIENYPLAKRRKYTPHRKSSLVQRSVEDQMQTYITRVTMQNPMSMFKKVVNHPYLIHFPLDPTNKRKSLLVDNELVTSSGKMMVLDAMLTKLKTRGHKVLIFSTLVMLLDMVEEYMIMKGFTYCRLDGSQSMDVRTERINEFNGNPDVLCFLLSTRAGGLGVNLTGADTVIFFDRDWNPQADIQAQDRCHRIGQTKPVVVYTLVTKNTIDERILALGHVKRRLEKLVIKDGKFKMANNTRLTTESELRELQQLLKSGDQAQKIHSNGSVFTDEELEKLLDRSDLYEQMKDLNKP